MNTIFNELFGEKEWPKERSDSEKRIYPEFRVKLCVIKYRNPRHEYFQFGIDMGLSNIDKVFNKEPLSGQLTFVFPERWMSVHEQSAFMLYLKQNPTAHEITGVDMITSCPMMVSSFTSESIRICTFPDDRTEY